MSSAVAAAESEANQTRQTTLGRVKQYCNLHALNKTTPMIWGPPGIGKSEVIEQLVNEYTAANPDGKPAKLIDVRLSLWDPTDVKGIPYFDHDTKTMMWAPPSELPSILGSSEYSRIILFLDELPAAPPSTQAAIYQLILNRRIGEYVLPDNVVIIGAGNRESDKGVTYRMPKPLANRFVHYEVKVVFDEWMDWAIDNRIHSDIVGYLQNNKRDLFIFNPKSSDKSFPTPRSWKFVHDVLTNLDNDPRLLQSMGAENKDQERQSMITDIIAGCIGEGTALKFMAHREVSVRLPNSRDIVLGKNPKLDTDHIAALYTLTTNIAYELSDIYHNTPEGLDVSNCVDNALGYWMKHLDPELIVMGTRTLFKKYKMADIKIRELSNWPEFKDRYGKLVHGA